MKQLLTDEELDFLADQGLSACDVYDGREETARVRSNNAKKAGNKIVLRNPSSKNCGHRLVSRSGNCVQCNTSALAYGSLDDKEGYVYIAASRSLHALKIGSTKDPDHREKMLTSQRCAAVSDWTMLFFVKLERSGLVERKAQASLGDHKITLPYQRDGDEQMAKEIFECDYTIALDAIAKAAQELRLEPKSKTFQRHGAKLFLT